MEELLASSVNLACPLCNFTGAAGRKSGRGQRQNLIRHLACEHEVLEKLLAEDISTGRVKVLSQRSHESTPSSSTLQPKVTDSNEVILFIRFV